MAYQKQEFIDYMYKKGNGQPGGYCNGLDNIEKLFMVDIDMEFEKDECESLYQMIQLTRKNPEKVGKNEHTVRQYASNLRKYIEFKKSENVETSLEKEFELWMTEQPQLRSHDRRYSSNTIRTFLRILKNGGERLECAHLGYDDFFHISDFNEFKKIYNSTYTIASFKDEQGGYRDYKDSLDYYLKFLKERSEKSFEKNIRKLIVDYKKDFAKIDKEERYKWEAIKHYKDNWDIDDPDFAGMLEQAFAKTFNLLAAGQYFARKMLVGFSQEHPEEVRKLFKVLYDESLSLAERFDSFRAGFDTFIEGQKINHYQDLHAISVYLTFEYPEKYYIYKFGVYDAYIEYIDKPLPAWIKKHETSKIKYNNMLLDELVGFIKADNELISLSQNRLDDNCYNDPEYHLLAFDIMFYASHQKDTDINPYYEEGETLKTNSIAKNTILYGPPGTGKTYKTACYAVAIVENKDVEEILEEAKENYSNVFERYNAYKNEGLVEFVTFHQSYGYEDFIEGIKPVLETDGEEQSDLQYKVTDGIFKAFCNTARNPISKNKVDDYGLNKNPTVWKVSLWSTGDNPIRTECMEKGHIRIGWDDYGPEITSETDFSEIGGRNVLNSFIYKMQKGDIVLSCYSNTTIDAIGVVTGDYEWSGEYDDLNRLRKVNWLVKGIEENIVEMNGGTVFTLASVYKANVSVADALSIVEKYSQLTPAYENKKQNMVFIIDEINRGNISKIFGELITLVEDSKRIAADEELKVVLPYSQKPFGVPDNVYILGTMNTADRSIAALDTALRRRFSFVEMMPDADVLENVVVEGINISKMLVQINKRIEVLFDREHTIGHAYFIKLTNSSKIDELAEIFKNKIIPLLQEYFYEDYERIRLVLADNQVDQSNTELQFITSEDVEVSKLFGNTDEAILDEMKSFVINKEALNNPLAYKKIYE